MPDRYIQDAGFRSRFHSRAAPSLRLLVHEEGPPCIKLE